MAFFGRTMAEYLEMLALDPDGAPAFDPGCRQRPGQLRRHPDALVYGDIEAFYREKYAALERFSADYRKRRDTGRYVAGALPSLPFADQAFDLVITANFLMVYAPLGDGGMHDSDRRSAVRGAHDPIDFAPADPAEAFHCQTTASETESRPTGS